MRTRLRHVAALVAVAAVVLVGCGDDSGDSSSGDQERPADAVFLEGDDVEILAIDNVFQPEDAAVAAGTTVRWTNNGRNDHNIIPEDEDAAWRVEAEDFVPGDEVEFTFDEPGTYRYFCSIHGTIDVGMIGTLTIE